MTPQLSASEITIRPSSLPSYQDCARRTVARGMPGLVRRAGYELRDTEAPVGAAVGTATHAGAAYSLQAKMDTGGLGDPTEAVQRGLQAFDDAAGTGVLYDDATPRASDAHRQIQRMVMTYRISVAPAIQPVAVEQRLVARLDARFILSGQKDTRTREPNRIRDLKTGARQRVNTAQYGAYATLDRAHGQPCAEVVEDFIPRVPLRRPQPGPTSTAVPADQAERVAWAVLHRLRTDMNAWLDGDAARSIVAGDPMAFPANPNSQMCGPKYCPAFGTPFCTEHRR